MFVLRTNVKIKNCEDLVVLADIYQIRIKIISTKGPDDVNVSTNWIYPDEKLKMFAELKDALLGDMTLLHEDDVHFNLVINKNSDLALLGSLSYRFNIGPIIREVKSSEVNANSAENDEEKPEDDASKDLTFVKKELNKCEKGKQYIEGEYFKCE